ncbi:MAG: hypothetical protein LKJ94_01825 [Candidatus Methanomethylophilus sp.]|nr:hypothetical protein [Methanomethylophilus sp.]MCI2074437.1 hypothetical protein [Methanomethylophilus sp.]MCI2092766.1 hypothetical protein [Methanomethylophilus sp.]
MFRLELRGALKKLNLKGPEKRREYIRSHKDWRWIEEMYPIIRINLCRVWLMSDKRFMLPIDPIIGPKLTIWSESDAGSTRTSVLRSSFLVVDEVDTFKKDILDLIIDEQKNPVDIIRAFRDLERKLDRWKYLPDDVKKPSAWWEKHRNEITIEERFRRIKDRCEKIESRFRTDFPFKLKNVDEDGEYERAPFLFRDYEPNFVGNVFSIKQDEKEPRNNILSGKGVSSKRSSAAVMFDEISKVFDRVAMLVRDLAYNYSSSHPEKEEQSSLDSIVSSILDIFEFHREFKDFLATIISHNRANTIDKKVISVKDPSFYSRGFQYIGMHDSPDHDFQTYMRLTDYGLTPEFVMRRICESTKVIGLSATAVIDSPISNFSFAYLEESGVYVHVPSKDDRALLRKDVARYAVGYEDGQVVADSIEVRGGYSRSSWKKIFDNPDNIDGIHEKVGSFGSYDPDSDEGKEYAQCRYVRAATAFRRFLDEPVRSMIAFFTALAKKEGLDFSKEILREIFERLAKEKGLNAAFIEKSSDSDNLQHDDSTVYVAFVNSFNFESIWGNIVEKLLEEGRKVFILTAYNTLGAGQNLQYKIPEGTLDNLVKINDLEDKGEKDIDAIYLDDPKSIGPIVEYGNKKTLDEYLFFVEFVDNANEIQIPYKRAQIGVAFSRCYVPNYYKHPSHFKDTDAYRKAKARALIQAVGRICRTNMKSKRILVLFDSDIAYSGTFSLDKDAYGRYFNREFEVFYDKVKEIGSVPQEKPADKLAIDEAIRKSHSYYRYVSDLKSSVFYGVEESIEDWKKLREFVLRHPVLEKGFESDISVERKAARYGYICPPDGSNGCWFTIDTDFDFNGTEGLKISFEGPIGEGSTCISSDGSRLSLMCQDSDIKKMLESNGIPTVFGKGKLIMSPPLFRNIYMGALGEKVGKFVLESHIEGLNLDDITNHENYEMFDFQLPNGVFFDFKNWSTMHTSDSKHTEKIINQIFFKLKKCGGRKAFIINVVSDGRMNLNEMPDPRIQDGMKIFEVPYLFRVRKEGVFYNECAIKAISREVQRCRRDLI